MGGRRHTVYKLSPRATRLRQLLLHAKASVDFKDELIVTNKVSLD